MVYTHTFEINTNGVPLEGEISFNHGEEARFITEQGEEMTVAQHAMLQALLECLVNFYKSQGEIEKLEINRKV